MKKLLILSLLCTSSIVFGQGLTVTNKTNGYINFKIEWYQQDLFKFKEDWDYKTSETKNIGSGGSTSIDAPYSTISYIYCGNNQGETLFEFHNTNKGTNLGWAYLTVNNDRTTKFDH